MIYVLFEPVSTKTECNKSHKMTVFISGLIITNLICVKTLPVVQPGLFVISGVTSCGQGSGYCLLGADCTINEDFFADDKGHCGGLRTGFTPEAHFSCCRYTNQNSTFNTHDLTLPPTSTLDGDVNTSTQSVVEDSTDQLGQLYIHDATDIEIQNDIDENRKGRLEDLGALPEFPETGIIDTNNFNCSASENRDGVKFDDRVTNVVAQNGIQPRNMNDENAGESDKGAAILAPKQRFQLARRFSTDMESRDLNVSRDRSDEVEVYPVRLNLPDELRSNSNTLKDKFGKNTCLNLTDEADNARKCVNVWKFVSNNTMICFGTLINSVWLLTSASCITRIFENGMDSVTVADVDESSGFYGISNMIVHENYRTEDQSEMHDVGLVSLDKVTSSSCLVCLSKQEKKYADKSCSTYAMSVNRNNTESLSKCEDRLKVLNMHSKMYLSLSCPSNEERTIPIQDNNANTLWCENILVGVGTSFDQGIFVFTPINEYADWIRQNIQQYL